MLALQPQYILLRPSQRLLGSKRTVFETLTISLWHRLTAPKARPPMRLRVDPQHTVEMAHHAIDQQLGKTHAIVDITDSRQRLL